VAAALVLPASALVACDAEDRRDVEEGVNNVKQKAKDAAEEVEKRADQADTDGKDD
jgi:hypothetical protein